MTDYRAELQRLVKAYDEHGGRWPDHHEQALSDAVEAARTALAQPEPEGVETQPAPSGYAYRYPSIEGSMIRFNHGREVNGSRPLCAIPYWLGQPPTPQPSPVPVAEGVGEKQVMDLADDCAFDRQEISGFDGGRTFHGHGWECTDEQLVTFATELLTRYARTTLAQPEPEGLPPRVGHILRLAEIIREVDGNHGKGAAALAEAILSHPGSRWSPTTEPVPVAERPWEREKGWRDLDGECWWCPPKGTPYWRMVNPAMACEGWLLPAHALPIPQPTQPSSPHDITQ